MLNLIQHRKVERLCGPETSSGRRKGFTLAEVLITLGIIGVVASMTIPTLMHNIGNQQLQAQFTKAYSVLSQAIEQMRSDEEQVWAAYNRRDNNGNAGYDPQTTFQNAFEKYFKIVQDCGTTGCVPTSNASYKNFSNTGYYNGSGMTQKQFYISDGMLICPATYNSPNTLLAIYIDTNGYGKGPNRAGYDLFMFEITSDDRLTPEGAPNTYWTDQTNYCNQGSNMSQNGINCAVNAVSDPNYFKNLP